MKLKINGESIKEDVINAEIESLRPYYEQYVSEHNENGTDAQLAEWSKENIIERTLLQQEAKNTITNITKANIEEEYKKAEQNYEGMSKKAAFADIELQLQVDELMKQLSDNTAEPDDKEILEYYNANPEMFSAPEQVHAAHIERRITSEAAEKETYLEMLNIREKLKQGANFEELAAENSDCANYDLGYFSRGQMVQIFEDTVFAMKPNDISDVFRTEFGYHIAKLYEKQEAGLLPLEDVKEHIKDRLSAEKHTKVIEKYVDNLKEKASIENE